MIAGGLAVVAHGYLRTTKDLDIVVALDPDNARRAAAALRRLGYRPMVPVALEDFADPAKRESWRREKNATVLRLHSNEHPTTSVDLFLYEPFAFDRAYGAALREDVAPGVEAVFPSLDDLLDMKRVAGRPQDLADIHQLEGIRERLRQEERDRDPDTSG